MTDRRAPRAVARGDAASLVLRPPRWPLVIIATVVALTVPLALVAVVSGDVVLGVAASVSAGWAAGLAFVGLTARTSIDEAGLVVRWMRSTEGAAWIDVAAVEIDRAGPGRAPRGARVRRTDGRAVRLVPWVPLLWFARPAAAAGVDQLITVLTGIDAAPPVTDPDALAPTAGSSDRGGHHLRR